MAGLGTAAKADLFRPEEGDHRQSDGDPNAVRYYEQARMKYGKKKYPEALEAIEKLLVYDPLHAGGLLLNAMVLEAMGRYEESRSQYENVLAKHPTLSQAHREFGRYLLREEQSLQSAESYLLRGLIINPQDSFAHALLADVYIRTNRKQQAVLHLEIAFRQPVDDLRYCETCAHVLGRLGEGDEEVDYLRHAILSNSENRALKNRVRKALRAQEKAKKELPAIKRVIQRVWS
ncbi:tetratricopeptide repeat protein [Desmospora profundinema]|uniref:Tetratricopeptide (TPR) repeat protein n=1 Tax=Desmospora profundinema TaxID=1571184 RepID=A0ABU1IRI7_9BACL|nr:tetratricopeptide repeat protein [Desmospora profundinema]MDR6227417.1 tetratricopeptide (TPR) repeat protein [Desmospora profundinema]